MSLCSPCQTRFRANQARRRERVQGTRTCQGCCKREALPDGTKCGPCRALANLSHDKYRDMWHNVGWYAHLLTECHNPKAQCSVLKRSQFVLNKAGYKLSVDRIDPRLGYTKGNTRLLTLELNEAKGDGATVPQPAINKVLRKLAGLCEDRLSSPDGASRKV